jgi:hypothetical protein
MLPVLTLAWLLLLLLLLLLQVRVASSSLAAANDMAPPDFVYEYTDLGVAGVLVLFEFHTDAFWQERGCSPAIGWALTA